MYNVPIMLIPSNVTATDIQRNYRAVFNQVKNQGSVVVMTNNQPDVMIISMNEADKFYQNVRKKELEQAQQAISGYKQAAKQHKLIRGKTLADYL